MQSLFLDRYAMIVLEVLDLGDGMKKGFALLFAVLFAIGITGCTASREEVSVVATTKPVYDFTSRLCEGTDIQVTQLVTESVSCLHDYTLSVSQVRKAEAAQVTVISGAGLEDFMEDLFHGTVIDSSANVPLLECSEEHEHEHDHGHSHEADNHIWLAPENAKLMAANICEGLCAVYPAWETKLRENAAALQAELELLQAYGREQLRELSCRELITFHDGFGYLARAFDLEIAAAVEEESGSEASARELIALIRLVRDRSIPAVFCEINGSVSAPGIIAAETGVSVHALDMCMGESDYFESMYRNIDVIKEALG